MNNHCTAAALALAVTTHAHAQWSLVWSDEFNGSSIDTNVWEHMVGNGSAYGIPGWGNNELQIYTTDATNSYVQNGTLRIVATEPSPGQYRSARLRTLNNVDIMYGRIEARMKLPTTQGMWPAFWMLPTNSPYGGWAASGEIDIMESVNTADRIHGTIHFGDNWPGNVSNGGDYAGGIDYSADFHVFAIEWEPNQIRWYMDGINYHTANNNQWWSDAAPGNPLAPFDNAFHMLLNVAVGGNWPGPPDGSTQFPQTLEVDYVRVFEADSSNATLQNGSFEIPGTPLSSWSTFGNSIPNILHEQLFPSDGVSHAKLFGQFIGPNACGIFQDVDAGPGETWTASVRAAHEAFDAIEGSNQGWMTLEFIDAADQIIASTATNTLNASSPTGAYQDFSVQATAPVGTVSARIVLGYTQSASNPNAGAIYYDEASLDQTPVACSPADITTTGAGAGDPGFGVPDGAVTTTDINYYVNLWTSLDPGADFTTTGAGAGDPGFGVPDGQVTSTDLNYYVNLWVAGCP